MSTPVLTDRAGYPSPRSARRRWLRAAVSIAVAEAVLVFVGVIPTGWAVAAAVLVVATYILARGRAPEQLRGALRAGALSQALVLFVPVILVIVGWIVVASLVVAAAVLVLVLLVDR